MERQGHGRPPQQLDVCDSIVDDSRGATAPETSQRSHVNLVTFLLTKRLVVLTLELA